MTKKRKPILITPPKKRMHFVLFAPNSPFKGKKTKNKKAYVRKPRNGNQDLE